MHTHAHIHTRLEALYTSPGHQYDRDKVRWFPQTTMLSQDVHIEIVLDTEDILTHFHRHL